MISQTIIIYDTETGSVDPHTCEVLSIAAVALDGNTLEIRGKFESLIKPEDEANIQQAALDVNNLKLEDLRKAPSLQSVWKTFVEFVKQFNGGGNKWSYPIRAGYNIHSFDDHILTRLYDRFGPRNSIFHPTYSFDLLPLTFLWLEHNDKIKRFNMDTLRKFMGISEAGAHEALKDCLDCAELMKKYITLHRTIGPKIQFEGCFL